MLSYTTLNILLDNFNPNHTIENKENKYKNRKKRKTITLFVKEITLLGKSSTSYKIYAPSIYKATLIYMLYSCLHCHYHQRRTPNIILRKNDNCCF